MLSSSSLMKSSRMCWTTNESSTQSWKLNICSVAFFPLVHSFIPASCKGWKFLPPSTQIHTETKLSFLLGGKTGDTQNEQAWDWNGKSTENKRYTRNNINFDSKSEHKLSSNSKSRRNLLRIINFHCFLLCPHSTATNGWAHLLITHF